MYAETPKQFNKTYRICIAHTEQDIHTIIWMGVFSGNKTVFVRQGHILCSTLYIKFTTIACITLSRYHDTLVSDCTH